MKLLHLKQWKKIQPRQSNTHSTHPKKNRTKNSNNTQTKLISEQTGDMLIHPQVPNNQYKRQTDHNKYPVTGTPQINTNPHAQYLRNIEGERFSRKFPHQNHQFNPSSDLTEGFIKTSQDAKHQEKGNTVKKNHRELVPLK